MNILLTLRTNGMNFKIQWKVWNVADCRMFVGCWFVNKKIATNPLRYAGDMLALNETIIRNGKVDLKIPYENVASYRIC